MTRLAFQLSALVLVVSLVLTAGTSGFLRTTHAIASVGLETIVICGSEGAETVMLDRNGTPVSPSSEQCLHCADCNLPTIAAFVPVSGFSVRGFSLVSYHVPQDRPVRLTARVENPSRGPPSLNEILWT
ncbi:hypothetical protein SAMN06265173_10953 [Thalassovita litoralis]|jgi:hypothetical protein|uniref:DUF2946 domain-containing protein n=1 Tax=Thalassovita litoralis TaxID=1010611 RepID=A0A521D6T4_9RHOB|nr:hypothetical protein [Thalassovita litoralis]SMO67325.1 hypothetical protein SAMN06265173_10953 [Thalassovita litoralis]